jgi:O-antigen ligase
MSVTMSQHLLIQLMIGPDSSILIKMQGQHPIHSSALSSVIFIGLLAIVSLTPIPYGSVERWWTAAFDVAVFALAALWFVDCGLSRRFPSRAQLWFLSPLLGCALYAFIQTIPFGHESTPLGSLPRAISFDPYQTKLFTITFLALTFVLAMLLQYVSNRKRLLILAHCVIAIVFMSAAFGLIRQIIQHDQIGFLLPALEKGSGYAQFINKNHSAFLAEMGLGLLLGLSGGRAFAWSRSLIYVAIALPIWTALVLSNSRGGIFAMTAQVIFLLLVLTVVATTTRKTSSVATLGRAPKLALQFVLGAMLIVGIVIGTIWIGGESLAERLRSARQEIVTQSTDKSHADRASIWRATLQICREHPFTGVGFGGFWIAITRYHQGSGELTPQQAHNDYLELAASGGVIGVALFSWFAALVITRTCRQLKSADRVRRALALGAATALFGVAVHSLVDFGLHLPGIAVVCIAIVAIATQDLEQH